MFSNHATDLVGIYYLWSKTFTSSDRFQTLEILEEFRWADKQLAMHLSASTIFQMIFFNFCHISFSNIISIINSYTSKNRERESVPFWNNLQIKRNATAAKNEWYDKA